MALYDPIILLGTGRCGSTYFQKLLCQLEDIWIWGEHDGILASLSGLQRHFEADKPLTKWSLTYPTITNSIEVNPDQANFFAWNNGFTHQLINDLSRDFIVRMFTSGLPDGKRRWGFKEIRYGFTDNVPQLMLSLFPKAKIVVIARDPVGTIVSTITAWHHAEILSYRLHKPNRLGELIRHYYSRWMLFYKNMETLTNLYPLHVHSVSLTNPDHLYELLKFLEVHNHSASPKPGLEPFNASPTSVDENTICFIKQQIANLSLPDTDCISRLRAQFRF